MTKLLEHMHDFGIKTDNSKAGYFVRSDNFGVKIIVLSVRNNQTKCSLLLNTLSRIIT